VNADQIAAAAQLACLLEVSAPKPGNVSPEHDFHDTRYEDFLASAIAIGPAFAEAGRRPLGATIRRAVEDTARWSRRNTNLGIVLLLAPLAKAACLTGGSLRERLSRVLAGTTVTDAEEAYAAIRLAQPGGLGRSASEDVAQPPTVTLREAMRLAAKRDTVAREYVTDFAVTFDIGTPAIRTARSSGLTWRDATMEGYLALLAAVPDTHVTRKLGPDEAARISGRARAVMEAGGVRTAAGRATIAALDTELRDAKNSRNPGTTADLTCGALFVVILEDGWTS
jgi:triphosphoribosyl-dephospho-CoA synthase